MNCCQLSVVPPRLCCWLQAREAAEELARSRGRSPPKVKKKNALEDDNPFHDQRGMGAVFEFFEDRKVQVSRQFFGGSVCSGWHQWVIHDAIVV